MTTFTFAERALDLFRQRPPVENRIDWLANQLLAVAVESDYLSLRFVPSTDGVRTFECSDSQNVVTSVDPGPQRLFRTLLARLAKMAEEENGTEFTPYGGELHFDRMGLHDSVRVNVVFTNTTVAQSLMMSKVISCSA